MNQNYVSPELHFSLVSRSGRLRVTGGSVDENVSLEEGEDHGNLEVVLVKMANI